MLSKVKPVIISSIAFFESIIELPQEIFEWDKIEWNESDIWNELQQVKFFYWLDKTPRKQVWRNEILEGRNFFEKFFCR